MTVEAFMWAWIYMGYVVATLSVLLLLLITINNKE
jgi:hypothetical protein